MQKSLPTILAASALTLGVCPRAFARQSAIEPSINSRGKLIFTNNIENNPTPLPKAVRGIPGPAEISSVVPAPSSKLGSAVSALAASLKPDGMSATQMAPEEIARMITAISLQHGVDPELVAAVIKAESNYNQWAVSSKGARGLMQLIPATGQRFGVRNLFDARDNIQGGVRYLRFLLEKFDGNIELSLAAYNAGEGVVERLGRIPPYDETRAYVTKIRSVYTKKSALLLPLVVNTDSTPPVNTTPAPTVTPVAPAKTVAPPAPAPPAPAPAKAVALPEESRIYSRIDARGVSHFSNNGPLD
jgi:hypothetical protein